MDSKRVIRFDSFIIIIPDSDYPRTGGQGPETGSPGSALIINKAGLGAFGLLTSHETKFT